MITKDIFEDFFVNHIDEASFIEEFNKNHDYMLLELHVFNTGGFFTFESMDYCDLTNTEAADSGNLFVDKDSLSSFISEVNPALFNEL